MNEMDRLCQTRHNRALHTQLIAAVVTRLTVNLEAREVEMELSLGEEISAAKAQKAIWAWSGTSARSGADQAQWCQRLKIAFVACQGTVGKRRHPACFLHVQP
jgi:hypothetical protein